MLNLCPYLSYSICHPSTHSLHFNRYISASTALYHFSSSVYSSDFFSPLFVFLSVPVFSAAGIVRKKQWCEMVPCLEDEGCDLLVNKSGWTCTQPGGRVKTTTVSSGSLLAPQVTQSTHTAVGVCKMCALTAPVPL